MTDGASRGDRLRVLDLYSGLGSKPEVDGGWGKAFARRGHEVVTLDWEAKFGSDLCMDVRAFALEPQRFLDEVGVRRGFLTAEDVAAGRHWLPDVVLASPDCSTFSHLANGHWEVTGPRKAPVKRPVSKRALEAVELVRTTVGLIQWLEARAKEEERAFWWWMENPVGMMAALDFLAAFPRVTVHYCKYGVKAQKPTHLWGRHPKTWRPRGPLCKAGDPCHPPGEEGIVAMDSSAERALIPLELSLDVCLAVESAGPEMSTTTDEGLRRRMAADLVTAEVFGPELKRWRQAFHVSQGELAYHLGVQPSVVSDYEGGRRPNPGVQTVRQLIDGLLRMDAQKGGTVNERQDATARAAEDLGPAVAVEISNDGKGRAGRRASSTVSAGGTFDGRRKQDWLTPPDLFRELDARFGFTMDGAASDANKLLPKASTEQRPLAWGGGERVL